MRKAKILGVAGAAIAIFLAASFIFPTGAAAKSKLMAVEGVSYNVDSSMADNLKSLMDKHVYVTLDSGKSFSGVLKKVGNHLLHLEKLDGKNYFDALIRIEDISAIDVKFRQIQR